MGEFMGRAPTGKRFTITWIDIFGIQDGKLVEAWLEINVESFKKQLGSAQKAAEETGVS